MTTKLSIFNGKGIHLTFDNSWTISIQIGYGNYCDNYQNEAVTRLGADANYPTSTTAEVWTWDGCGHEIPEQPIGYMPIDDALAMIDEVRKRPSIIEAKIIVNENSDKLLPPVEL